jgi:hypothetical protein
LTRKPEQNRLLGNARHKAEYYINIGPEQIALELFWLRI